MAQFAEKMQTVIVTKQLINITGKREHRMTTSAGWGDKFPGFEKFMLESQEKGLRFAVFNGKENIGEEDLGKPAGRDVIRIAPVISGSKRARLLHTIVGAVLIAVSFIPGFQGLAPAGIALVAGGVIQMLSPQAKGLGTQDSPNNRPSYSFNGAVNTCVQGRFSTAG